MDRLGSVFPHSKAVRHQQAGQAQAPARGQHRSAQYDILWRSGQNPGAKRSGDATESAGADDLQMDFSIFIDTSALNMIPEGVVPGAPVGEWCPATIVGHTLQLHFVNDDVLLAGIPQVLMETIGDRGYALIIEIGANLRPERAYYASLALGEAFQKSLHR